MVDGLMEICSVIQEQYSEARKEDKTLMQNTARGEQRKRDPKHDSEEMIETGRIQSEKARDMRVSRRNLSAVSNAVRGQINVD